jgi:hypothetical protein
VKKNLKITHGDTWEYNKEYDLLNKEKIVLENGKILSNS